MAVQMVAYLVVKMAVSTAALSDMRRADLMVAQMAAQMVAQMVAYLVEKMAV
jgi:putative flippase GtrA